MIRRRAILGNAGQQGGEAGSQKSDCRSDCRLLTIVILIQVGSHAGHYSLSS